MVALQHENAMLEPQVLDYIEDDETVFEHGPLERLAEEGQLVAYKFRDYWLAKAGKDGAKLDWSATWRNWVRNSLEFSPAAKPGFQTQGERNQDVLQGLTRGAVGGGNVKLLGS